MDPSQVVSVCRRLLYEHSNSDYLRPRTQSRLESGHEMDPNLLTGDRSRFNSRVVTDLTEDASIQSLPTR